jgi:hypothetical protein
MAELDLMQLDAELRHLVAKERGELIHFLRRLELFDREGGCARLAKGSLFEYLVKDHHMSEPTAWRRSNAVRLLREFPQLEAPIADGRIGLTVLGVLGQVMTSENVDELIRRGTHLTKRQAEELVVSIRPRQVRADGIRKVPELSPAPASVPAEPSPSPAAELSPVKVDPTPPLALVREERGVPEERPPERASLSSAVRPVRAGAWTLQVTLDGARKEKVERLQALLSHRIPDGDVNALFDYMLDCTLEKAGKQRGAVRPERTREPLEPLPRPRGERDPIPLEVRREVWERDGGRCTYVSPDGRRCESCWQLEFHHTGLAGNTGSTAKDLTIRCKPHDVLDAVDVFGREHIEARIAERRARQGELLSL